MHEALLAKLPSCGMPSCLFDFVSSLLCDGAVPVVGGGLMFSSFLTGASSGVPLSSVRSPALTLFIGGLLDIPKAALSDHLSSHTLESHRQQTCSFVSDLDAVFA